MADVKQIWEDRYKVGGNSGLGSYGIYATHKAKFINKYLQGIESIIELGCGDGNQLTYYNFENINYIGVDISEYIIDKCRKRFAADKNKDFITWDEYDSGLYLEHTVDLTMSIDVLYHLVNNDMYYDYMNKLFKQSNNLVIIYSSNFDEYDHSFDGINGHVRHRKFVRDIPMEFELIEHPTEKIGESSAEFFVYKRKI